MNKPAPYAELPNKRLKLAARVDLGNESFFSAPQLRRDPLGRTSCMGTDRHIHHPVVRVSAALLGAAFALVILLTAMEMLKSLSLAFPLFFLAACVVLPTIACIGAMSTDPPRYARILRAGALSSLLPGIAGIWFDLSMLDNPLTIATLMWPLLSTTAGLVIGLLCCAVGHWRYGRRNRAA